MKILWALLLTLTAAGCVTAPQVDPTDASPPLQLDDLVPIARNHAADIYHQNPTNLWFWAVDCHYDDEATAHDATNSLEWYNVSFYDPESIERVPQRGNTSVTAMGYHIRLTPDGELRSHSSGRGLGWSQ